jgi:integrase
MLAGWQLKALAPRTIRGVRAVLRAALSEAVRWGLVGRNAAALAHAPRVVRPKLQVLSTDEGKTFLAAIEGDRLKAFFTFLIAAGLRLGEALGLRWIDVALERGTVRIDQALQRDGTEVRFVEPKSDRSRKTVSLPTFAVEALKHHKKRQNGERRLAGSRWTTSG